MIGTKINKPLETQEQLDEYTQLAEWCNENHATIEDMSDCYVVVALPQPTLEDVKALKIAALKCERDRREVEPVQTTKGLFDYDDKSRDRLTIARQALMDNDSIPFLSWTTADHQRVPLAISDFAEINFMAAYRSNLLHFKYNELKELVNACETVEEVDAIAWPEEQNE